MKRAEAAVTKPLSTSGLLSDDVLASLLMYCGPVPDSRNDRVSLRRILAIFRVTGTLIVDHRSLNDYMTKLLYAIDAVHEGNISNELRYKIAIEYIEHARRRYKP